MNVKMISIGIPIIHVWQKRYQCRYTIS